MNRRLAIALSAFGVGALTFVIFLSTRNGEFLNWDDEALIVQNADFRGLGWAQLSWMFRTTYMGHYQPLTWLSFALNYDAGQLNPAGYHLVNVFLHSAAAVLLFGIIRRILLVSLPSADDNARLIASIVGALFFAIHPLRVESVAWITERRDVLSANFLLASVWAWLNYVAGGRRAASFYILSIALLALSLLSKAWGMTLFAVLLVLDVYPLRRWSPARVGRLLVEKIPFLMLGLAAAAMALKAQIASVTAIRQRSWDYRILQSICGLAFYPWKTLLPTGLSPIYEHPARLSIGQPRVLAALVAVAGITVTLIALRRRWSAGLAAWTTYAITVSPVLGVVQAGPQFVADRYSYLACIPFVVLLSAGMAMAISRQAGRVVAGGAAIVLIALMTLTTLQIPIWRDSWSLWRAAARHDPASWNANSNLGSLYFKANDFTAAERHFRLAVSAAPDFALPTVNLAWCLGRMGRNDECLLLLRKAAAMHNASDNDLLMIANGLTALKKPDEARPVLEQLIERTPGDGEARFRLANILNEAGEVAGAQEQYRRAIELLEPSLLAGPVDVQHDLVAAMYVQACRNLVKSLVAGGNSVAAEPYIGKLKAIDSQVAGSGGASQYR